VTENIPYISQGQVTSVEPSAPTVINTYAYKDVGVILKLTPHISHGGMVRLVLDSTYSTVVPTTNAPAGTITTETREAQTVVTMRSGATIVLGGLISDTKTLQFSKVPILGDIPLLGFLFQFKSNQNQKTNLLLFITPHVLTSRPDVAAAPAPQQSEAHAAGPAPQEGAALKRAASARR
jgi:general secretion pathway protein D